MEHVSDGRHRSAANPICQPIPADSTPIGVPTARGAWMGYGTTPGGGVEGAGEADELEEVRTARCGSEV